MAGASIGIQYAGQCVPQLTAAREVADKPVLSKLLRQVVRDLQYRRLCGVQRARVVARVCKPLCNPALELTLLCRDCARSQGVVLRIQNK